ncbi:MAG TPA: hypothetical protein PLC27_07640 [Saprospiraceae bacterium]|nr:hypothetical protein [Saprospiraceae bacterium]MBK6665388.1 hypothetical protein [Saprospiraceae bacterium]MBK7699619.1 hypothetical protein [Saprospiraceae bacterium]MBK8825623.1 hypothetical protein [Saprospiraceae bacterium]MBK8887250.1 hypothetical protein [Saprospiraceae bacterium]
MNTKISKKIVIFASLIIMAVSFTSCNRGYGCPYELKSAVKIITPIQVR